MSDIYDFPTFTESIYSKILHSSLDRLTFIPKVQVLLCLKNAKIWKKNFKQVKQII